ncbi:MAG: phosphate acetyltransferase [Puniceicoccales bacterium]|jgi:phosphate acetyltransferase|nr:phosphate acetyltransferase [Puniceicoccales bacterium]
MNLIQRLCSRLQNHPKRVVFPEGNDPRILQAARLYATRRMGIPILLGDRTHIRINAARLNLSLDGIRVINPEESEDMPDYIVKFKGYQRFRDIGEGETVEYLRNPNYFAAMMLVTGAADAMVSGATTGAASGLRPIFQIVPRQEGVKTISSMLILEKEDPARGVNGTLFLADCAVIPEPNVEQLADIAYTTGLLANHLTGVAARVAMLAYTTKSISPKTHPSIARIKAACALVQERVHDMDPQCVFVDGELQVDAALDPFAAESKAVSSDVAGRANVLVFPDLNAANIAAKLVQVVADIPAYGQVLTGLAKPVAEISRGASAHDILGTAVLVAAQAVDRKYLYPEAGPQRAN